MENEAIKTLVKFRRTIVEDVKKPSKSLAQREKKLLQDLLRFIFKREPSQAELDMAQAE